MEALPQLVWVMDADGAIQYANRRWADMPGLQACRPPCIATIGAATGMRGKPPSRGKRPSGAELRLRRAVDATHR